ncbi:TlpA family protein disulfide reductase [Jiangella aurantiaca]|uniref:TlpA family protein disulfide reductase n=1 Tax=Jiangella aurantiaca TaxID=2530373 RepID=A0A4R5ARU2_9ACTN|nr:TlpA family protein disulfide reductase [Jiangella aurantiaca]
MRRVVRRLVLRRFGGVRRRAGAHPGRQPAPARRAVQRGGRVPLHPRRGRLHHRGRRRRRGGARRAAERYRGEDDGRQLPRGHAAADDVRHGGRGRGADLGRRPEVRGGRRLRGAHRAERGRRTDRRGVDLVRRVLTGVVAAAVTMGLVAGCSGSDDPATVSFDLPGDVPSDVTFVDAPPDAPPAPPFELGLLDGSTLDVAEHWEQRPVVLVFFESFCELCAQQQAEITELSEEYRDAILFVGVGSASSEDDAAEYVREHDISYPVGLDASGEVFRRYGVDEPPLVALIARGGQLVRGWPGGVQDLGAQLTEFVVAAAR